MSDDNPRQDGSTDKQNSCADSFPSSSSGHSPGDVTQILSAIEQGDGHAAAELMPLVYGELRKLAAARMFDEKPGQTLQATALVHEAYVRLVDVEQAQHWTSRRHFFSAAAEAMRRLLIEAARRKGGPQRGGNWQRVELDEDMAAREEPSLDLLALNEAIGQFEIAHPDKAELVKLKFFGGLSTDDAATALGISRSTAKRYWIYARAWLHRQVGDA